MTCKFGLNNRSVDVRFGSKADIGSAQVHVRFVPEADIRVIELAKPTTQF
jgi:hypothetical protein